MADSGVLAWPAVVQALDSNFNLRAPSSAPGRNRSYRLHPNGPALVSRNEDGRILIGLPFAAPALAAALKEQRSGASGGRFCYLIESEDALAQVIMAMTVRDVGEPGEGVVWIS